MSQLDANTNWYVRNKGKTFGPFTRDQIAAMKRSGRVTAATEVSTDRQQWSKADAIPGLFAIAKSSDASPIDDSPHGEIPLEPLAQSPNDAHAWYYSDGEARRGPVSYAELQALAAQGQILAETLVWNKTLKSWSPASAATDLQFANASQTSSVAPASTAKNPAKLKPRRASLDDANDSAFGLSGTHDHAETYGILEPFIQFFHELFAIMIYIVTARMLKKKAVRWVIGFGLFPLALIYLREEFQLEAWITMSLLGIYFALFWAAFFHAILRPSGPVWNRGVLWAVVVVVIGIPLLLLSHNMSVQQTLLKKALSSPKVLDRFIGFTFGVGFPEEFVKVLPFFLFALSRGQKIDARSGLFWGISCGFGFAIAEAVMQYNRMHASQFFLSSIRIDQAAQSSRATGSERDAVIFQLYAGIVTGQVTRFISLPLLHAAWSGINGWFIASASNSKNSAFPALIVGLLLTALLHGTYDTFVGSTSLGGRAIGVSSAVVSLLLFLAYMSKALDQASDAESTASDI